MKPPQITRAAVYVRVSSEEQIDGTSLDTQRERCLAFAQAKGWTVTEVYADEGVSGAKASRPALDRLMAACEAHQVDAVVVLKTDRFSRSRAHLFAALEALSGLGVAFTSVTEAFDTSTTSGDAMVGMLGVFAQMERNMIRERTRTGVNAKVRAGGWGGGQHAPYGYRVAGEGRDARLEVAPDEAKVVRQAVSMIVDQQLGTNDAANRLNALGLTPRTAPLWTSQNLRNCLRRGQWGGTWTFGKVSPMHSVPEPITQTVEAILDPTQFAALQAHLGATALTRGAASAHPLSGRLVCPCGQPMTGIARSDRATRRYRCRHSHQHPGRITCHLPSLQGATVDDAVWAQVLDLLTDPDRLMAMARERLGMLTTAAEVTADALQDAEDAVRRTQEALARGAARCIGLGLDGPTTEATIRELRGQHLAAVEHRATVAAMRSETTEAKARLTTAQRLAGVARERLLTADADLRAKVFSMMNVRAVVTRQGDDVQIHVTGSVAHDLLLAGITPPSPGVLATVAGSHQGSRRGVAPRLAV
ncbi:MAG: recombinase family protein, partial [Propionicimonas sp.]